MMCCRFLTLCLLAALSLPGQSQRFAMAASPMTYEIDGRQYLLRPIQNVILAWALPATPVK